MTVAVFFNTFQNLFLLFFLFIFAASPPRDWFCFAPHTFFDAYYGGVRLRCRVHVVRALFSGSRDRRLGFDQVKYERYANISRLLRSCWRLTAWRRFTVKKTTKNRLHLKRVQFTVMLTPSPSPNNFGTLARKHVFSEFKILVLILVHLFYRFLCYSECIIVDEFGTLKQRIVTLATWTEKKKKKDICGTLVEIFTAKNGLAHGDTLYLHPRIPFNLALKKASDNDVKKSQWDSRWPSADSKFYGWSQVNQLRVR